MINPAANQRGVILFSVLILASVLMLLVGAMLLSGQTALKSMQGWRSHDATLFKAQSVMGKAKYDIYSKFRTYYTAPPAANLASKFAWFDTWSAHSLGSSSAYQAPNAADAGDGYVVTVTIDNVQKTGRGVRTVGLKAQATASDGTTRTVYELVRYRLAPSDVFDYAYFINNFGWLYGSSITINGNVRANGNVETKSTPTVNGDVTAAANPVLATIGDVYGSGWRSDSLSSYRSSSGTSARPTDPPSTTWAGNWKMGYSGTVVEREKHTVLDMPYIAALDDYEYLATEMNGQIKVGNTVVVDNIYDGAGPDGVTGTADDGMVVLNGTSSKPITISGPVVVRGDVVIKGVVTGQGTIYAKRNVHIAGNVSYKNAPSWVKPDNDPEGTVKTNTAKDMLGLAAKGNIILGDYTTSAVYNSTYFKPPFVKPYDTDPTDSDIGYDTDGNASNGCRFDGNYTVLDGGKKINTSGKQADRKYCDSSNDQAFKAVSPSTITRIDGVLYTNHLCGGSTGSIVVNGAIISRDEGINFSGAFKINWDIRLGSESPDGMDIDIYLPRSLVRPLSLYWREVRP
jgi:cytoskeletal protein CcmA (bactofilin family)